MARRKETERAEAKAVVHEACQVIKEFLKGKVSLC